MDYREVPPDRADEFRRFLQYAFSPEDGPEADHDWEMDDQPGAPRGLLDGDEMLCVCRHYWLQTGLRGQQFEMAGLSAVASPPEHRRKGHVTRLLAESLAEYRDRGTLLTGLWAFEHSFYERHGWGLANKLVRYECDPENLSFARDHASGSFRPVEADEFELLDPVLEADREGYELGVDRTEEWWRKRVLGHWREDPYAYVWERDGEVRGYVVYRISDGEDGKRLRATEVTAADREARLNLLRFLANHDSQVETVVLYGRPDCRLLDSADSPGEIDCEVRPGPMVRLVDVPAAVEALDYPDATDSSFVLSVADPLADWNDRTFRVSVADGRATCEPTDADPGVRADVGTLSQVFVGYHSVADAEVLGSLDFEDDEARGTLSAMFPEREVFLGENF